MKLGRLLHLKTEILKMFNKINAFLCVPKTEFQRLGVMTERCQHQFNCNDGSIRPNSAGVVA
jgi:hypothetical protein